MNTELLLYHGYRFPSEIVGSSIWSYFRCGLSFGKVEEFLAAERGITVLFKTIWRCLSRPGSPWRLDERFLRFQDQSHYLGGLSIKVEM